MWIGILNNFLCFVQEKKTITFCNILCESSSVQTMLIRKKIVGHSLVNRSLRIVKCFCLRTNFPFDILCTIVSVRQPGDPVV